MKNIVVNKVVNRLSQGNPETLACARVVCHTEHTHTGIVNTCSFSDHARVRARAIPAHIVDAWRERIFADGIEDPVKVAVEEAVKDFGEAGRSTSLSKTINRLIKPQTQGGAASRRATTDMAERDAPPPCRRQSIG